MAGSGTIAVDLEPGDASASAAIGCETPGFRTEVPGPPPPLQTGSIRPVRTASATASIRVRTRSLAQTFSRYPDAVADMLKIARHRGWDQIRVTGDTAFRREVWIQAQALGLEVRGHRPRERDRQAAGQDRSLRDPDAARPSPAPEPLAERLARAAVVVARLIPDPVAQSRLLERAWARAEMIRPKDRDGHRDLDRTR